MILKKYTYLIFLLLVSLHTVQAKNIKVNTTYTSDTEISPFEKGTISSLLISGNISLQSDTSLIRIILVDTNDDEYLVYEAYPYIVDSVITDFTDEALETEFLNNIYPKSIKIQAVEGALTINQITINSNTNKIATNDIKSKTKNKIKEKNKNHIANINKRNQEEKMPWIAGETNISELTYAEKKQMFGGEKFQTYGLEYYIGGIFILPNEYKDIQQKNTKDKPLADGLDEEPNRLNYGSQTTATTQDYDEYYGDFVFDFDWRAMHNANMASSKYYSGDELGGGWMTSVKYQWGGSCSTYSALGTIEAVANLYFNQHIELDLSEHQVLACDGSMNPYNVYEYIIKTGGVVDELCFENPDNGVTASCEDKCDNPSEIIQIDSHSRFLEDRTTSNFKKLVVQSPVACGVIYLGHAMVLVGFHEVKKGDLFQFLGGTGNNYEYIIEDENDPLIGETMWIFKNSYGTDLWGHNGYLYIVTSNVGNFSMYPFNTPITSLNYDDTDIQCLDLDGDGYYNWGIGPKPAHCPPCPDEPDGNDNDKNIGPVDIFGCFSINLPYEYGFEDGLVGWKQDLNDDFDWLRHTGATPSSSTGPSGASEGSYYMYLESSNPNYPVKRAVLYSPSINLTKPCKSTLRFDYHMYGGGIGELTVFISIDGGENWSDTIFESSGNQGDDWKTAVVDLSGYYGNIVKLKFAGSTGSNYLSDIAIDNVRIIDELSDMEYINSSQVWSDYRNLCSDIRITNNSTLTITGKVVMLDFSNITVDEGSELIIDGGSIENTSIYVTSGGKLTLQNGGAIVLKNGTINVEDGGMLDITDGEIQKIE